jgi:hypothetical protein
LAPPENRSLAERAQNERTRIRDAIVNTFKPAQKQRDETFGGGVSYLLQRG